MQIIHAVQIPQWCRSTLDSLSYGLRVSTQLLVRKVQKLIFLVASCTLRNAPENQEKKVRKLKLYKKKSSHNITPSLMVIRVPRNGGRYLICSNLPLRNSEISEVQYNTQGSNSARLYLSDNRLEFYIKLGSK